MAAKTKIKERRGKDVLWEIYQTINTQILPNIFPIEYNLHLSFVEVHLSLAQCFSSSFRNKIRLWKLESISFVGKKLFNRCRELLAWFFDSLVFGGDSLVCSTRDIKKKNFGFYCKQYSGISYRTSKVDFETGRLPLFFFFGTKAQLKKGKETKKKSSN